MTTPKALSEAERRRMNRRFAEAAGLVVMYLGAIVAANLSSTHWGPEASIYNAFFFIGLDLVSRDKLHDLWGPRRFVYMALLILTGSGLSFLVNHNAAQIAEASAIAFGAAAFTDALVYEVFKLRPWLERVNMSNVPAAIVDSFVFVSIAFGLHGNGNIVFGQIAAKIGGGALWALAIVYALGRREAEQTA